MKSILYSVCIGTVALALAMSGAQATKDKGSGRSTPQRGSAAVHTSRPATTSRTMSAQRHVAVAPSQQRSYAAPRTSSAGNRATRTASATRATARERNVARNTRTTRRASRSTAATRNQNPSANRNRNVAANRARNANMNRERNVTANPTRNVNANRERNVAINRNRNVGVNRTTNAAAYYRGPNARVTNNWRGNAFRGQRYAPFRNYNRQWHDRSWWRSHYNRIVFVNNGWWFWNAGYWFPAWGYAPYVTFAFDGPIYGYNGLTPDQVTVNVQQQLAAAGYYTGPIDGELGPMTREAIANYQADNGLAVTSAIDEPTLATMGLV